MYSDQAILDLNPSHTLLSIISLREILPDFKLSTKIFFVIDRSLCLDDINRVKMLWVCRDPQRHEELGYIQEVNGQTVMQAFKNSVFLGFNWEMPDGSAFQVPASTKGMVSPKAGESLFDTFMQILKTKQEGKAFVTPETYQHIKANVKRMQGLSDYVYFMGRAKSLYIACQRLMDTHRDLPQDAILFPSQPPKYEFPIGLVNRAKVLHIDLIDYKGYTPASQDLQSALNGLELAILSLRNSVTSPSKESEKFLRARASSGFLMAFLSLKRLHENQLKGV